MRVKPVVGALLTMSLLMLSVSPALATECTHATRTSGQCTTIGAVVAEGGVTVSGTQVTPGTSGSGFRGSFTPPPPRDPVLGSPNCEVKIAGLCRGTSPAKNTPGGEAPTPPQSLNDLVEFYPENVGFVTEPAGWSLPLLPMNMVASATTTTQSGDLLGWPVEVRFTPVAYRWSYGDGLSRVTFSPGVSWGARQFTPTGTSHSYELSGDYQVSLSVTFTASYRFDQGNFVSLPGQITQPQGIASVKVLSVTPVLVERGCHSETLVLGRC